MPSKDAISWFKGHFATKIAAVVSATPFTTDVITAIACQETGYIWDRLRRYLPVGKVLELCVGDTIDFTPPDKGRKAFPKNKSELLGQPRGEEMFSIGRTSLLEMSQYLTDYRGAAANPLKFCHGFGIFQFDLQHFTTDPDFFLHKHWADFDRCLALCVAELEKARRRINLHRKTTLSDLELCQVAIAYNRGSYNPAKGLKQGYKSGGKYYGENIADYLKLAHETPGAEPPQDDQSPELRDNTVLPAPTPVEATGKTYLVEVETGPLNMRSTPEIPRKNSRRNIIARLPDGQPVKAVSGRTQGQFLEVETSLRGAHYRGWVSTTYLIETPQPVPIEPATPVPPDRETQLCAVHAPRRSSSICSRRDPATAHSLNEPGQPGRKGSTPAELIDSLHAIIGWLDVENPDHRRYQKTSQATFCNIYAHDYCHLAGVYLPRVWWTASALTRFAQGEEVLPQFNATIEEMRANMLFGWLRDFGLDFGWRQTGSPTKLQDAANQGAVCLIVARRQSDGPPGHITAVAPETPHHAARRNAAGEVIAPLQSQAGSHNFCLSAGTANWWQHERFAESAFWIHA